MKSFGSKPNSMSEDNLPRRTFLKGVSATAAPVAIMLTIDAKLKSQDGGDKGEPFVPPAGTGHVYMYMEPE